MKRFEIIDGNRNETRIIIEAGSGKSALNKFLRNYCMNTGMYEIHRNKHAKQWCMSSSYGSWFTAREIKASGIIQYRGRKYYYAQNGENKPITLERA